MGASEDVLLAASGAGPARKWFSRNPDTPYDYLNAGSGGGSPIALAYDERVVLESVQHATNRIDIILPKIIAADDGKSLGYIHMAGDNTNTLGIVRVTPDQADQLTPFLARNTYQYYEILNKNFIGRLTWVAQYDPSVSGGMWVPGEGSAIVVYTGTAI